MQIYTTPNYRENISLENQVYLDNHLNIKEKWNKEEILELIGIISQSEIHNHKYYKKQTFKNILTTSLWLN